MRLTKEAPARIHDAGWITDKDPLSLTEAFAASVPRRPQDNTAKIPTDYFYALENVALTMWPASERPLPLPSIDFYFGSNVLLEHFFLEGQGKITRFQLLNELMQVPTRLHNWNNARAGELEQRFWDTIAGANKVAYVSCHGDSYESAEGMFWTLTALDVAYGADRVVRSLIAQNKYDLLVMSACNPHALPLAVESNQATPRPTILRFNMMNNFLLEGDEDPIVIIPPNRGE